MFNKLNPRLHQDRLHRALPGPCGHVRGDGEAPLPRLKKPIGAPAAQKLLLLRAPGGTLKHHSHWYQSPCARSRARPWTSTAAAHTLMRNRAREQSLCGNRLVGRVAIIFISLTHWLSPGDRAVLNLSHHARLGERVHEHRLHAAFHGLRAA